MYLLTSRGPEANKSTSDDLNFVEFYFFIVSIPPHTNNN